MVPPDKKLSMFFFELTSMIEILNSDCTPEFVEDNSLSEL
jgi:hypothetical protein